jgi:hypothetical protein
MAGPSPAKGIGGCVAIRLYNRVSSTGQPCPPTEIAIARRCGCRPAEPAVRRGVCGLDFVFTSLSALAAKVARAYSQVS